MEKHIVDCLDRADYPALPNHGPTLIEIQRWEDDGGALPDERPSRRRKPHRHGHEEPHELAAAE